ncbi:hypothetical protein LCGC14_2495620, partial [marine sediment metagenome]
HQGGSLTTGEDTLIFPGGPVTIGAGLTLRAGGHINRQVVGEPDVKAAADNNTSLIAVGDMIVGNLTESGGWSYTGDLHVAGYSVTLLHPGVARLYGATLGATPDEIGTLSSANGLQVQTGFANGLVGYGGVVNSRVDFVAGAWAINYSNPFDEDFELLYMNGIVSGSPQFFGGISLEFGALLPNSQMLPSKGDKGGMNAVVFNGGTTPNVLVKANGPRGFPANNNAWDNPANRDYQQYFAAAMEFPTPFGVIREDTTMVQGSLTFEPVDGFNPGPGEEFEIFQSVDANGFGGGTFMGWFDPVTLIGMNAGTEMDQWDWRFELAEGSASVDEGWLSATLFMHSDIVIPDLLLPLETVLGDAVPGNHQAYVDAIGPIGDWAPESMHFEINSTKATVETALYVADGAYLAGLTPTDGLEGLLYESADGLFNGFTLAVAPDPSYDLYLWDGADWALEGTVDVGTAVDFANDFGAAQSAFLIWGVDLDSDPALFAQEYAFEVDLD